MDHGNTRLDWLDYAMHFIRLLCDLIFIMHHNTAAMHRQGKVPKVRQSLMHLASSHFTSFLVSVAALLSMISTNIHHNMLFRFTSESNDKRFMSCYVLMV